MQKKLHNSVSYRDSHKHVILCSSELKPMVLRDFLAEFFSDPKNLVCVRVYVCCEGVFVFVCSGHALCCAGGEGATTIHQGQLKFVCV